MQKYSDQFKEVLEFHGCFCPDIAMGYRVAKALNREFNLDRTSTKKVIAEVGQLTCAADAIQLMCGCTPGKRNLQNIDTGKATFELRSTDTGRTVRIYVKYWESFDQAGFRLLKKNFKAENNSANTTRELTARLEQIIQAILDAPESELFNIELLQRETVTVRSGFEAQQCQRCKEFVRVDKLVSEAGLAVCAECSRDVSLKA